MPRIDHDAAVAYVLSLIDDWSERGKAKERELNCLRYVADMADAAKRLEEALRYYAEGQHFPPNWRDEDGIAGVEDGWVARAALASMPQKEEG